MNSIGASFFAVGALAIAVQIWLATTTTYLLEADRLVIRRAGGVWMEVPFEDIDEVAVGWVMASRLFQIRLFQFGFRKMVRIRKRRGFRFVLINPENPQAILDAISHFRAHHVRRDTSSSYPGVELKSSPDRN